MGDRRTPVLGRPDAAEANDMTLVDAYAAGRLDDVEERLIVRFCPPLRPEEVQRRAELGDQALLEGPRHLGLVRFEQAHVGLDLSRHRPRGTEPAALARPTLVASGGGD